MTPLGLSPMNLYLFKQQDNLSSKKTNKYFLQYNLLSTPYVVKT